VLLTRLGGIVSGMTSYVSVFDSVELPPVSNASTWTFSVVPAEAMVGTTTSRL